MTSWFNGIEIKLLAFQELNIFTKMQFECQQLWETQGIISFIITTVLPALSFEELFICLSQTLEKRTKNPCQICKLFMIVITVSNCAHCTSSFSWSVTHPSFLWLFHFHFWPISCSEVNVQKSNFCHHLLLPLKAVTHELTKNSLANSESNFRSLLTRLRVKLQKEEP